MLLSLLHSHLHPLCVCFGPARYIVVRDGDVVVRDGDFAARVAAGFVVLWVVVLCDTGGIINTIVTSKGVVVMGWEVAGSWEMGLLGSVRVR